MKKQFMDEAELARFGELLGSRLEGGEVLELVGDVGAGKTTLTKAIARGMGIAVPIQSPTFTISNRYETPHGLVLAHYDFYRLNDAGLMGDELEESIDDSNTVTVIEWADIVSDVLPKNRVTITLRPTSETSREASMTIHGSTRPAYRELA